MKIILLKFGLLFRPDEIDDYRIVSNETDFSSKSVLNNIELKSNDLDSKIIDRMSEKELNKRQIILKTIMNILCGIEKFDDELTQEVALQKQNEIESKRRIENFYSLNQTKFEKYVLNLNLLFILTIAVCLYVFFSIPPQLHIFSHINLNSTIYNESMNSVKN